MQTLIKESIQLLKEIIAIPSPSFQEEEASLHISSFLEKCGINHQRLRNNIIAVNENFRPGRKTLMLCAHIDTVEPCSGYGFDPYNPETIAASDAINEDNGTCRHHSQDLDKGQNHTTASAPDSLIPGLGANDDGASAVCMIAAFRYFYKTDMPFNLMLVLSAEEERSGANGMQLVRESIDAGLAIKNAGRTENAAARNFSGTVQYFPVPDHAIVGEPTGMKAAVAERGLLVIDGCAAGLSGHAARGEGLNALYIAIEDINKLRGFKFGKTSPLMGDVRLSVTQIRAGTAHNVIPDICTFVADIRPTEQYDNKEILQMLQAECRSTLTARNLNNRSSATKPDSPLLRCAKDTGIETFVSPTTSDWMRIGCDAIKMGPGDSSRSHRKNEYVTSREIEDGTTTYIRFITNYGKYL